MGMENILAEPEGAPITVFSVQLYQQWKHHNDCKEDTLFIVYKDKDNHKKVRALRNPKMEIYFVKPEYRSEFLTPREYLEISKTYSKTVPARQVLKTIYHEVAASEDRQSRIMKTMYDRAYQTGDRQAQKEIFKWPYTLMSDMSVEEYYRVMLGHHYNQIRNHIIDKAYLDIEADIYGLTSTEQTANLDKVNACTLIFNFDPNRPKPMEPQVYTFLLRDHSRYPQQEEFERNIDSFLQMCHDTLDHQEITRDGKKKVLDFVAEYHIIMCDTEPQLLKGIFDTLNRYRPDTCSVWNIAYDIPKLAARMEANGMNYVEVMCDPAFPKNCQFVEMNIDSRPQIDIADRKTYIRMASTICWIDQMQSYAGIRKGRKAYGSNKLDNIAKIELGVGKHTFGPGIDVSNAAIKDYWNFVYYNIIDVMRQVMIDIMTNDSMSMILDMNQQNCSLENLTKQTRYQKQIYYSQYLKRGFVPGNNVNIHYSKGESEDFMEKVEEARIARELRQEQDEEDDAQEGSEENELTRADRAAMELTKGVSSVYEDSIDRKTPLPGGMVGNPDYNSANGTELISGVQSKHVFDDVLDMDFASEYPWAKYTRSLSRSTQIGRLIISKKVSDRQNVLPMGQEKRIQEIEAYLPGGEFVADYISHDILSFGNVWFNLPTAADLDRKLTEMNKSKESGDTKNDN